MAEAANITGGPVRVSGLRELDHALGRASKSARKELRAGLREIAASVRDTARAKAEEQGFTPPGRSQRGTGELMRKLSYSVRGGVAAITEGAVRTTGKNAPFRYPAVYEFGNGGSRAFLLPALDEKRGEIAARFDSMLDRLGQEFET